MPPGYHHGNLRPALIEVAVELARTEGPEGVVLREVARRAGVSHNAAYRHFADREELLTEVAVVGMAALAQAMHKRLGAVRAQDSTARARRRLRAVGRAYVEFALNRPGLFRVAFAKSPLHHNGKVDPGRSAGGADQAGPYALLNQVLDEMVAAGAMPAAHRPGAEVTCWSAVHGFSLLHLDGPLAHVAPAERDQALESMLGRIEAGLCC